MEGTIEYSLRPKVDRLDFEIWSQSQPEELFVALAIVNSYLKKILQENKATAEGLKEVGAASKLIENLKEECAGVIQDKARNYFSGDEDGDDEGDFYDNP